MDIPATAGRTDSSAEDSTRARTDKLLASESSENWKAVVHSLEVGTDGRVYVALLVHPLTLQALADSYRAGPDVVATDDDGATYARPLASPNGGWPIPLERVASQSAAGTPHSITITVHPTTVGKTKVETFTFRNLPPPPATENAGSVPEEIIAE